MPDIKQWIAQVERVAPPEQWSEITGIAPATEPRPASDPARRSHRAPDMRPSPWRKVAVIATAFALTAAATGVVVRAFRSDRPVRPAQLVPTLRSNGDIWASVGSGEGGITIYRVDPQTGSDSILWSDGLDVTVPADHVNKPAVGEDYSFSPDGSKVVFSASTQLGFDHGLVQELFVMNADGTDIRQLTFDQGADEFPTWSPDGSSIAYSGDRGVALACIGTAICAPHIYVIDASGGTPRQLTDDSFNDSEPSWSPDGSKLVFVNVAGNEHWNLFTMNADGGDRTRITTGAHQYTSFPTWSPDGQRILFLRSGQGQPAHLWTVAPDGSDERDLRDTNADTDFGRPVWSPDGQQIAYASVVGGEPQLWLTDAFGLHAQKLAAWPGLGGSPIAWRSAPTSAAAAVAQVVCEKDGSTSITTPTVLAQPDGVHVRVIDRLGESASMEGLGFDVEPGTSDWTSAYRPGIQQVGCWPFSDQARGVLPATVPLMVLDPNHLFVEWELQCTPQDDGTALHIQLLASPDGRRDASITPDEARPLIKGLLADDQVVTTGYPDQVHQTVDVIRDGRRIASVGFSFQNGRWIQAGGNVCGGAIEVP